MYGVEHGNPGHSNEEKNAIYQIQANREEIREMITKDNVVWRNFSCSGPIREASRCRHRTIAKLCPGIETEWEHSILACSNLMVGYTGATIRT